MTYLYEALTGVLTIAPLRLQWPYKRVEEHKHPRITRENPSTPKFWYCPGHSGTVGNYVTLSYLMKVQNPRRNSQPLHHAMSHIEQVPRTFYSYTHTHNCERAQQASRPRALFFYIYVCISTALPYRNVLRNSKYA